MKSYNPSILNLLVLFLVFTIPSFAHHAAEEESYSLEGEWLRVTDVVTTSKSNIILYIPSEGQQGIITSVHAGCCFGVGDIKWRNIEKVAEDTYKVEEMWRYHDCGYAGYYPTTITFINTNEIELSSNGYITRWVRADMGPNV